MKRGTLLAAIGLAVCITATPLRAAEAPIQATVGSGDLDGDGQLTRNDLTLLRNSLLGKITLTAAQKTKADINGDGTITIGDIIRMLNQKPTIDTFAINSGAASTDIRTVFLDNACSFGPTDYIASESSAFTGAIWQPYAPAPTFMLSPGKGVKTVWFRVRNGFKTSDPKSANILFYTQSGGPTITLDLGGSPAVTLDMIKCPAGSFQMGTPSAERSRDSDEGPVHTITLSNAFYLGKYEVTQAQWIAITGRNPSNFQFANGGFPEDLSRPVEMVSWNDIAGPGGFIERLNQHLADTGQGGTVRLPTEAEWEYACRAGTTTRFYFGNSLGADDSFLDAPTGSATYPGNRSDYMWFRFNCIGDANGAYGSKPVGTKRPNAFGLYDMSGNVWEWCQDWYAPYTSGSQTDPAGPAGPLTYRVVRGGGWSYWAQDLRSGRRFRNFPGGDVDIDLGFRLARDE